MTNVQEKSRSVGISSFKAPATIWPVLVHTGHQLLLTDVCITERARATDSGELSLRIPGIYPQPAVVGFVKAKDKVFSMDEQSLPSPPFSLTPDEIEITHPRRAAVELFLDGRRIASRSTTIQPPTAIPGTTTQADALAALVQPNAPDVAELVRRARERRKYRVGRQGFPGLQPDAAARILYLELMRRKEPHFSWEPGPWSWRCDGQRIRLPHSVLIEGEATCIDLSLLLCSAIERIGRLSFLVGLRLGETEWHVLAGARRGEYDIVDSSLFNSLDEVKKQCSVDRVVLFDPDAIWNEQDATVADRLARAGLAEAKEAFLVDIQAARERGIWELQIRQRPVPPPCPLPKTPVIQQRSVENPCAAIAHKINTGGVVLLVGDVLDESAALSREELCRRLRSEIDQCDADLLLAGTLYESKYGSSQLRTQALRWLRESSTKQPTKVYRALSQIPFKAIISFHPDPQLERVATNGPRPYQALVTDEDLAYLYPEREQRALYLLGGSATTGEGLVISEIRHHHLRRRIQVIGRGLRDQLARNTLLLLSCDLSDYNLRELYLEATSHLGQRRSRPIYVCAGSNLDRWEGKYQIIPQDPVDFLLALSEMEFQKVEEVHTPAISPVSNIDPLRPYKYLDYFEAEDAHLFFGRDDAIEATTREVLASPSRVGVLLGRSGVGKTSLMKAGVIPALQRDGYLVAYVRCGFNPLAAVLKAINASARQEETLLTSEPIESSLRRLFARDGREQIVVVDQVEEAIIKLDAPLLQDFFNEVKSCLANPLSTTRFVFVIREDYLVPLGRFQAGFPGLLAVTLRLEELDREAARHAVTKPAEAVALDVDPELLEEMLNDISSDTFLPVHLQIVCEHLFRACRDQGALTFAAYEKLGRAEAILSRYLERTLKLLPRDLGATARTILRSLVTSKKTKDALDFARIAQRTGLKRKAIESALHDLIHIQRLVREVPEVPGGRLLFELSHESLATFISTWLDAEELRVREITEILNQEVANAQKFSKFVFPEDKLKLIDEYREKIDLTPEATRVLLRALSNQGPLDPYWAAKLSHLRPEDRFVALFGLPPDQIDEILEEQESLDLINKHRDALNINSIIVRSVIHAFAARGPLDTYWRTQLRSLVRRDRFLALVGVHPEQLNQIIGQEDKLKMINEHRHALELSLKEARVLLPYFAARGPLDDFWKMHLRQLKREDRFMVLLGVRSDRLNEIFEDEDKLHLLNEHRDDLELTLTESEALQK